jgi:hypothetical protein
LGGDTAINCREKRLQDIDRWMHGLQETIDTVSSRTPPLFYLVDYACFATIRNLFVTDMSSIRTFKSSVSPSSNHIPALQAREIASLPTGLRIGGNERKDSQFFIEA